MAEPLTSLRPAAACPPPRPSARPDLNGILVIDKPEGLTSFGVVSRVRKALRVKKAGHCGTLDPFATGVLVVCLNQATRIVDHLSNQDKRYRFVARLGVETDTLDRTGQVISTYDGPPLPLEAVQEALHAFRGVIVQEVPRYAAVRIEGRHLYEWTRKGIAIDLPEREVEIYDLKLLAYGWPEITLEAHCSKGTYIRQMGADIGRFLRCGAHVQTLKRLSSGGFCIEQALSLDALAEQAASGEWSERLISMSDALGHLPALRIDREPLLERLADGYLDPEWEARTREHFRGRKDPVRMVAGSDDRLVALWWPHPETEQKRRLRVFG